MVVAACVAVLCTREPWLGRLALPSFAQGSCGGAADVGFCPVNALYGNGRRSPAPCKSLLQGDKNFIETKARPARKFRAGRVYFSPVRISRTETPSVLQRLANISVRGRLFMSAYFPTVRGDMPGFFLRDRAVRDGFPHPLPDFLDPDRVKIIAQCAFFT